MLATAHPRSPPPAFPLPSLPSLAGGLVKLSATLLDEKLRVLAVAQSGGL
jgi:hypothetical protein